MSSALVVYGTKSGCTTGVADTIAERLTARGIAVDVKSAADGPDPAGYDAVIVGSGVRVGQWHEPVRNWTTTHAATLKEMPVAFFTVCLTLAQAPEKVDEVRGYSDAVAQSAGIDPLDTGLFAGWNVAEEFTLIERLVLKALKAPKGDFRDFDAVAAWADGAATTLGLEV